MTAADKSLGVLSEYKYFSIANSDRIIVVGMFFLFSFEREFVEVLTLCRARVLMLVFRAIGCPERVEKWTVG